MFKKQIIRFLVDGENVYKCSNSNPKGTYVGTITDRETMELLVSAPALKQMNDFRSKHKHANPNISDIDNGDTCGTLRPRNYKPGAIENFSRALYSLFRRS